LRKRAFNGCNLHSHARHRKRKNFISKIVSEEQVLTNHEDKAAAIFEFYNQLMGTSVDQDLTINLDELDLSQHDLANLDEPFTKDEVWVTIKHLPLDKAPGPDGYTGRFYKTCWQIIKKDIMVAIATI
jgi:hypothetical protein